MMLSARKGPFMPYNAQGTKRVLMQFEENAGPDQPAHSRRLIWAFVVR